MKVTRYSFCFTLIFTISLVMIISGIVTISYADRGEQLAGADLSGADLRYADLQHADLRDADLSGADLFGADLFGANLRFANLFGADLSGANLSSADLSFAYLFGADLSGANLGGANLRKADLSGADLSGANLDGTDLQNQNIDCKLKNPPRWDKTAEIGEAFTITWDNPDTNNCKYNVIMYDQNKNKVQGTTGSWTGITTQLEITQNYAGQSYFKICNANENWCTKFIDVNVIDTAMNNTMNNIMIGIVAAIVAVIGISGGVIYLKTKKSRTIIQTSSTSVSSSTAVPASTEKPQEENITDIDKQIAINEEKIRKMEEESKKLDEES